MGKPCRHLRDAPPVTPACLTVCQLGVRGPRVADVESARDANGAGQPGHLDPSVTGTQYKATMRIQFG